MASINKVILVGNLGRDPESRTFPSGDMVTNVSIATTDKWRDKATGEEKSATEWHRVSFHGRLAEIASQYLRQGSQVYIEGSLRTRKYQKDGVDHYATEIRADQMQMLGARQDGGGGRGGDGGYDDGGYNQGGRQAGQQQPQQPQQRQQGGGNQHQQGNGNQGGWQQRQAPQGQQRQAPQQSQQRGPQQGGQHDNQRYSNPQSQQAPQRADSGFDSMDDDIPF